MGARVQLLGGFLIATNAIAALVEQARGFQNGALGSALKLRQRESAPASNPLCTTCCELMRIWLHPPRCPAYPAREDCEYIDDVFAAEAAAAITAHAAESEPGPFMLIFAAHGVHAPLQLPRRRLNQVPIHQEYPDWRRRRYAGMVTQFDEHVGLLKDAMVAGGWWENGLIVMSSDNGKDSKLSQYIVAQKHSKCRPGFTTSTTA